MTIYLHNENDPIEYAERFETMESAARHILNYDMQDSGIEKDDDGLYTPWQRPHRLPLRKWTAASGYDFEEVCRAVVYMDDIAFIPLSEADYAALLAEMEGKSE